MGDINTLKNNTPITSIQGLADKPVLSTTAALKAKFDESPEAIRVVVNTLIDYLAKNNNTDDGASNIGINSPYATTVKSMFDYILGLGSGTLPADDAITLEKQNSTVKTGLLSALTTTVKTNIVNAINEIVTNIGSLASLTTTVKTSIVNAINEIITMIGYDISEIKYFARNTAPTGYLKANGAAVSRATYSALFAIIGTTFGVGDGSTTFNLPDGRGVVPRGWDDSRGLDVGRVFGSYQADGNKAHTHTGTTVSNGAHTHTYTTYALLPTRQNGGDNCWSGTASDNTGSSGAHTHTFTTNSDGNTEVTMKNIAWLCCIKY